MRAIYWGLLEKQQTSLMSHVLKGERLMKEAVDRQASASLPTSEKSVYVELDFDEEHQLEYVRYGIEMKMETHKAIRSQHKNY